MSTVRNELHPKLLSVNSINPFIRWISASRLQMFGSHITQALWVTGCNKPAIFAGNEVDFGKYTHAVKFEHDSHILKVINRYPRTIGVNSIKSSPEAVVIFEHKKYDDRNDSYYNEVDYLAVPKYHSQHRSFGFEFNVLDDSALYTDRIAEGTVIANSPTIDPETGAWMYGVEANLVLLTIPETIEDGYVVSESFCEKATTTCMETYEVSFGSSKTATNFLGDDDNYKIMPDIGEFIGDDGILMVLRKYDDRAAAVTMSRKALQDIDFKFDDVIYVEPGGEIVDIKVYHDYRVDGGTRGKVPSTPIGTTSQMEKYLNAGRTYWENIRKTHDDLARNRGGDLRLSPKFDNLVYQSYLHTVGIDGNTNGLKGDYNKAERTWRGVPIDEWRIEVTIKYPFKMSIGSKLTGRHGNKGVVVAIWPDADMPTSKDGVVADIIGDPISISKRMNPSVLIEQYINCASATTMRNILKMEATKVPFEDTWAYLMGYYSSVNANQEGYFADATDAERKNHLQSAITYYNDGHPTGIGLHMPTNLSETSTEIVKALEKNYPPEHGPVTYRGPEGNIVTTEDDVIIGSSYTMILEKIGRTWAGVSSAKLNHFGIPAKITNSTKNLTPGRTQPIRFGEAEVRLFMAFMGAKQTAEMIDRTNNPVARKEMQRNIIASKTPSGERSLINRRKFPVGGGRITGFVVHYMQVAGRAFKRFKKNRIPKDKV